MDCQKKRKRDDCFITFFIAATRDIKTERCRYTAGDRLLRRRKLVSAVEGRKSQEVNQLCDTTGSSGMESALDEVWWLLIRTSSGSWMDKPSSRANWLPLALSPFFSGPFKNGAKCCDSLEEGKKKEKKKRNKKSLLSHWRCNLSMFHWNILKTSSAFAQGERGQIMGWKQPSREDEMLAVSVSVNSVGYTKVMY